MTIDVVIIGDSHTDAIKRALKGRGSAGPEIQISANRISKVKNGKQIGDLSLEEAEQLAESLAPSGMLVSTIGGNQHQAFGLVQHPEPFDFHDPVSGGPIGQGAHILPYHAIWDVFERGLRGGDGTRLQRLKKAARGRCLHLTPPPPKQDAQHILRKFETDFAAKGILELGVTPAPVRLKLWKLQVRVTQHLCKEWGIELLPPPEGTQDPTGFLLPEFYADDATHANAPYGERVLQQLEAVLSA